MQTFDLKPIENVTNGRAFETYREAYDFSRARLETCQELIAEFLQDRRIDPKGICFVAVGSVGRLEALRASDLDILPVLQEDPEQVWPESVDQALRERLQQELQTKISRGSKLTAATWLKNLTDAEGIGGSLDTDATLTKRILILSEGAQAGGDLRIGEVRRRVVEAYGAMERTSGRHVLSLCNDLARYYRQLCIDYKNKVDAADKDWSTRNIKLRHSRKLWYFATLIAIASEATRKTHDEASYREALLMIFSRPPVLRLVNSLPEAGRPMATPILKSFAWFLRYMAKPENREALAKVEHGDRYEPDLENPFPALKHNSDVMHSAMIRLLDSLDTGTRHRVLDWFLL